MLALFLLMLLGCGIGAKVNDIPEGTEMILTALAGTSVLVGAWVEKANEKSRKPDPPDESAPKPK